MKKKMVALILAAVQALLCVVTLAGCGLSGGRMLSKEEIARANEAFAPEIWDEEEGKLVLNGFSRFFTSHYDDPKDLDFMEFLWNFPGGYSLTDDDAQEFQSVMMYSGAKVFYEVPSEYIVPVHRYRSEDVSAMLQKYAGITVEDLNSRENVIYLEEYGAFYNFTSDYAPGCFQCTAGRIEGDTVRLWSETEMLTLKNVDGRYLIQSFQTREK